jgi:hypothetical protein
MIRPPWYSHAQVGTFTAHLSDIHFNKVAQQCNEYQWKGERFLFVIKSQAIG